MVLDCQRLEAAGRRAGPGRQGHARPAGRGQARSHVSDHVAALAEAGLQPSILDVDSFALGNAFERGANWRRTRRPRSGGGAGGHRRLQDQHQHPAGTNSYFTREVYIAGNDFTDALAKKLSCEPAEAETQKRNPGTRPLKCSRVASVLDDLATRSTCPSTTSRTSSRRKSRKSTCPGGSLLVGVEETCQRTFGKPVVRWDPLDGMQIRARGIDENTLHENSSQLAIAVGLASRLRKSAAGFR